MRNRLWEALVTRPRQRARERMAFEGIVKASYRPNAGMVLPGEIPVIAPRPSDYERGREMDDLLDDEPGGIW